MILEEFYLVTQCYSLGIRTFGLISRTSVIQLKKDQKSIKLIFIVIILSVFFLYNEYRAFLFLANKLLSINSKKESSGYIFDSLKIFLFFNQERKPLAFFCEKKEDCVCMKALFLVKK